MDRLTKKFSSRAQVSQLSWHVLLWALCMAEGRMEATCAGPWPGSFPWGLLSSTTLLQAPPLRHHPWVTQSTAATACASEWESSTHTSEQAARSREYTLLLKNTSSWSKFKRHNNVKYESTYKKFQNIRGKTPPIGLQCLSKLLSIIIDLQFLSQSLIELVAENQSE